MPVRVKRKGTEYYDRTPYASRDGEVARGKIEHLTGTSEKLFVFEQRVSEEEFAKEWAKSIADMLGGKGRGGIKGETVKTLERILRLALRNREETEDAVEKSVTGTGKGIAIRFAYDALPEDLRDVFAPSCYYTGIKELLKNDVLSCSTEDCVYFLNPMYLLRPGENVIAKRLVLEEKQAKSPHGLGALPGERAQEEAGEIEGDEKQAARPGEDTASAQAKGEEKPLGAVSYTTVKVNPSNRAGYELKRYANELRVVDEAKEMSVRKKKRPPKRKGRTEYLPEGAKQTAFRVTDEEFAELKEYLRAMRAERGIVDTWGKKKEAKEAAL